MDGGRYGEGAWAAFWRDNGGDIGSVLFVVGFVGAIFIGFTVTPFFYIDALLQIATVLGPLLVAAACVSGLAGRFADRLADGQPMQVLNLSAGLVLLFVYCPGNVVLWANQRFDASPATLESVPVVDKTTSTRRGSTTYKAEVTTAVASPLGRHSLYGSQPVRLGKAQWQRVEPGRSRLVLREHRGAFRLTWYEPDVDVID